MRFMCILVVLCLLEITMSTMINYDESDEIPRVKIKVFRSPTQEGDGKFFATWGYWIQQPNK